jgi:Family of unknown function (DUF6527)
MKTERFSLQKVHYMPKLLEQGVLYVSGEFETAAHLCACGCGAKVRTPLGPTEWSFQESEVGPTLRPSVGNWQQDCNSHYLITKGRVYWTGQWSEGQILAGRAAEHTRRQAYFESLYPDRGLIGRFWNWLKSLF